MTKMSQNDSKIAQNNHFRTEMFFERGMFLNGNIFCESGRERTAKILFEPKKTFLGCEGDTTEIQRKYKGNTKEIQSKYERNMKELRRKYEGNMKEI